MKDSNLRPTGSKPATLSTELIPHKMERTKGLEPLTLCLENRNSTIELCSHGGKCWNRTNDHGFAVHGLSHLANFPCCLIWRDLRDLNSQPIGRQPIALTIELHSRKPNHYSFYGILHNHEKIKIQKIIHTWTP